MTALGTNKWIAALACLGVVFGSVAATPALASAAPDFAAVDRYVQDQVEEARLPGLALGIVHGAEVVHTRGFGKAAPSGPPVTAQTPFIIGSVSKSFTGLAIMQLVEAGKLDLGAPVQRYLPEFRLADATASAQITVSELLNDSSGLPTSAGIAPLSGRQLSLDDQVRALSAVAPVSAPGKAFHYSNSNYEVLGRLIEMVSGQSYGDYIQQHVFTPLAMQHSYASLPAARSGGLASSSTLWFGLPQPHPQGAGFRTDSLPAGYLVSSAEDMSHYLVAQLNSGRYGESSVLSPAGVDVLHRGTINGGISALGGSYAMGWFAGPRVTQKNSVWHNGSAAGMHSMVLMLPASKWGVVVLTNTESLLYEFLGRVDTIADNVMAMLTGKSLAGTLAGLYTAFDLFAVLLTGLLLRRLVRLIRRGPRRYTGRLARARGIVFNGAIPIWREAWVPLALLVGLPLLLGAPWLGNLDTTDIGQLVLGTCALLLASGITRLALLTQRRRRTIGDSQVGHVHASPGQRTEAHGRGLRRDPRS